MKSPHGIILLVDAWVVFFDGTAHLSVNWPVCQLGLAINVANLTTSTTIHELLPIREILFIHAGVSTDSVVGQ